MPEFTGEEIAVIEYAVVKLVGNYEFADVQDHIAAILNKIQELDNGQES